MHTTNQLLDALSAKYENATDYRLSKLLNTSTSAVTAYRKGRRIMSAAFAVKLAVLLNWDAAYTVACVEHERAQADSRLESTGEVLAVWDKIAEQFKPAAALVLIAALACFAHSESAQASTLLPNALIRQQNSEPVYTLCELTSLDHPQTDSTRRKLCGLPLVGLVRLAPQHTRSGCMFFGSGPSPRSRLVISSKAVDRQ
ncbi:MAG: hypothetical protein WDM77_09790 [Steroidobacteraceae bacterium]